MQLTFSNVVSVLALFVSITALLRVWFKDNAETKAKLAKRVSEFIKESEIAIEKARSIHNRIEIHVDQFTDELNSIENQVKKRKLEADLGLFRIIALNAQVETAMLLSTVEKIREYQYSPNQLQLETHFGELHKINSLLVRIEQKMAELA